MQFVKTATKFPTLVQKRIYAIALQQTPLEVSLGDTDGINTALGLMTEVRKQRIIIYVSRTKRYMELNCLILSISSLAIFGSCT